MRLLKWFPWRFFVTRTARAYGFLDPIQLLGRLRTFSKPSEVAEPVELLRAGVLFHARGLINTKAIQHNLDWIWPYWVERQFNPSDKSFIPRAFSFSHINLTHRNWTAVGLPNVAYYPIVDPRGLVTPLFDGWSIDFWLVGKNGRHLFPSKLDDIEQRWECGEHLHVISRVSENGWEIATDVTMVLSDHHPHCEIRVRAQADPETRLAVVLRPYNPEGISFIESIRLGEDRAHWMVNKRNRVTFDRPPERCLMSNYHEGDVSHALDHGAEHTEIACPVAMATGAALFPVESLADQPLIVRVPIFDELTERKEPSYATVPGWREEAAGFSRLEVPDEKIKSLYDAAVTSLILHSPGEVYPGPYTYKRFWYRDAAFMINAMISLGAVGRSRRALDIFPKRQTHAGYFLSQAGEWDSNGEALWIMHRYCQLTHQAAPPGWLPVVEKGARWILKKRLSKDLPDSHAGLLPAGFSAEHLGPNDFYYWDNFWAVSGLRAAADLLRPTRPGQAAHFAEAADEYLATIIASFKHIPDRQARGAISASPHRRLDAGAVGSLVADYPLQLFPPGEERLMKTVQFLMEHSFFGGGFFQNMIHSGINAYLTLHVAQVLLRAGDPRALELIDAVAGLASPTGQWPEAIHPQTLGGCMGDGHHVWASAEWAMMIRNLFVMEDSTGQRIPPAPSDRAGEPGRSALVIGAGLFPRWLEQHVPLSFGPALTPWGRISVRLIPEGAKGFKLTLETHWFGEAPRVEVRVPGYRVAGAPEATVFLLEPL